MPELITNWEIDAEGFTDFLLELERMSGQTFLKVLLDQVAAVLSLAVKYTPSASAGGLKKRASSLANYIKFEDGTAISVWRKAGGMTMFLDQTNFSPKSKSS